MSEPVASYDAARDLAEALRLTVEYVGNDILPAQEGWSWFDALKRYNPEMARPFVEKPIHFKKEPVLFSGTKYDPTTLSEVIGTGAGAVSACWENLSGAGEFDSSCASGIVDEMLAWIHAHYIPKPLVTDNYGLVIGDDPFGMMEDDG